MTMHTRNRRYGDAPRIVGVSSLGFSVEFSKWREGVRFRILVLASEEEAGMVHDLARMCLDMPVRGRNLKLNTETTARRMVGEIHEVPLNVNKSFLSEFLERHPVVGAGGTAMERAHAATEEIARLAPVALKELKEIVRKNSCCRGRQRTDLQEIVSLVKYDKLVNENQQLKATILEMGQAMKAKDQTIDAKDRTMKLRDDAFMALHQELYAATERASATVFPFKRGFAERE